ncbi:MAG: CvpA family protein [Cyclobacteriaceae bacterium]|nr:CvpA family protein [Cyclobacteriaceae bacterium]
MSAADIIIVILLLYGAYSGFKTGLILEIISILAFVLAIFGGFKLLHLGMEYVSKAYDFGSFLPFVAFLVIFVLILILVNLLGKLLKKVIDWTPLGVLDNFSGALIGMAKWALAISILLWVMSGLHIRLPDYVVSNSRILPYITDFASQVGSFISSIFPSFDSFVDTLEELFDSFKP